MQSSVSKVKAIFPLPLPTLCLPSSISFHPSLHKSPALRPQEDHPPSPRHPPASCRALGLLSGTGNPAGSRLWTPSCPWDPRKPFLAQPPSPESSKRGHCLYSVAPGSSGGKRDSKMSILGRLSDGGRWPGINLEAVHSKQTTIYLECIFTWGACGFIEGQAGRTEAGFRR